MVESGPHHAESLGFQHCDLFVNLEQRGDRKGSVHTAHTDRSQPRGGTHISHAKSNKDLQLEIDQLKRKLHHARQDRAPSNSDVSSKEEKNVSFRRRSRTPPSESFSYEVEHHHDRRHKSPQCGGLGNDAMSRVLNQISRSPFTRNIEGAILSRRLH